MPNNSVKRTCTHTNFERYRLNDETMHYLNGFYCGNRNIDQYVKDQALNDACIGNGVTYLIIDKDQNQLVAYYTLSTTAIRKDIDNSIGYPSVEIKMFAVRNEYQDTIYIGDGNDVLVAELILGNIIADLYHLSQNVLGFKFIVLHSVKEAVNFYKRTWFYEMDEYLMFEDFFTEGCVPMYIRLYQED